jgi:serine protease Do
MYSSIYCRCGNITSSSFNTCGFSNLANKSTAVVEVNVVKKLSQEELLQQQVPEILKRFFAIKSLFHNNARHKKDWYGSILLVKMVIY